MPTDDDLGPELSERLTYLLKRALLTLENLHGEHLANTGVTLRELSVLQLLAAHEPESQQQIAGRLGVDRTTMVGLLDALEGKGLVVRRADAADRRRNVVELTRPGELALREATRASDEAEQRLLEQLLDDDARQLRAFLRRIGN